MNSNCKNFLNTQQASFDANGNIAFPDGINAGSRAIYALTHLAVVTIAGKDAAKFLQGQCTCDINAISAAHSGFGALCNAKGRAISTFLIAKKDDAFLLILPAVLADTVINTLRRYVLRAAVTLTHGNDAYCLIGISGTTGSITDHPLPADVYGVTQAGSDLIVHFPALPARYLLIASSDSAPAHWTALCATGFNATDTAIWRHLDLDAGIPWLDTDSSEQYIPQMLNLDRLGGIGFNKGCYTGQEVVARTQYLGSVKRRMYYAECAATVQWESSMSIIDLDAGAETAVGKLLAAHRGEQTLHMLLVMQSSNADSKNLRLQNAEQDKITIKPLTYVTDA